MDEDSAELDSKTARWIRSLLPAGAEITGVETLGGGWSSLIRLIRLGSEPDLVLRTMVRPELADRAADMLGREARSLEMLACTASRFRGCSASIRAPPGARGRRC